MEVITTCTVLQTYRKKNGDIVRQFKETRKTANFTQDKSTNLNMPRNYFSPSKL